MVRLNTSTWMPALAAAGCLAVAASLAHAAAAKDRTNGNNSTSVNTPARGAPAGTAEPPVRFRTLPPGAQLPDDATCAQRVRPEPETEPLNAPYNTTAGTHGLPSSFFAAGSHDPRAVSQIIPRVSGAYTGPTGQILQWTACKWGIDERFVRAQAAVESSVRQATMGDWSTDPSHCAPGHGPGVDGRPGECPESWGVLQVRYRFFSGAFPGAIASTAFNLDTAYAVWRACYEGYEWWLRDTSAPGSQYRAGDHWGCIGRWFSGKWYDGLARQYIWCVQRMAYTREPCE